MAMKRCPDCGENYSDTYKYCPFCEEEALEREGTPARRGGRRSAPKNGSRSKNSYSLVTPTLLILILVMGALLIYLLFGDKLTGAEGPSRPGVSEVTPGGSSSGSQEPVSSTPGTMPEDPSVEPAPQVSYETVNNLPSGLTLNKTDFTIPVGDPDVQLTVSGGSGNYTWVSQDPAVATVDDKGKVKAIANGTVNVLVSDGNYKGTCIVRVKGGSAPASPSTPSAPASGASLNKTDYTTYVGDVNVQLKVQGVTSQVTWASKDNAVATVSNTGLVKAVGKGTTTVTATFDGVTLECIVRVK